VHRQPSDSAGIEWKRLLVAVVLIAATTGVYWGAYHSDFIDLDDQIFITQNDYVKNGLSYEGFKWAFVEIYRDYWHPVTWLSHMLDVEIFGLWAGGHHLVNLGIHLLNTLLLFGMLRYMTGRLWTSAFVAGLFAMHPLHVESVAWAAERKDVLSTFFWLATLWAYAYYASNMSIRRYLYVVILFALGLMSKPMVVTMPVVLLLLDYWPLERFRIYGFSVIAAEGHSLRRLVIEKIPLLAMSAAVMAVTIAGQSKTAMVKLELLDLPARLANVVVSYWWYISKTVWPTDLNVFYFSWHIPSGSELFVPLAILIAVTIVAAIAHNSHKYVAIGWLWYLITLVPVIGLVQVGGQTHADRYTYIPIVGLFITICWAVGDIVSHRPWLRSYVAVIAVVVLIAFGAVTHRTVGYWKDSITLFRRAIAVAPENAFMHSSLGGVLSSKGRLDEAETELREALRLSPDSKFALSGMGYLMKQKGKTEESLAYYRKALAVNPRYPEAYMGIGMVLSDIGRYDQAQENLNKALALKPEWPEALCRLGTVMRKKGHFEDAIGLYKKALQINPMMPDAWADLGMLFYNTGRNDDAIRSFRRAIKLDHGMARAYMGLGMANEVGNPEEALAACRKAIELAPKLSEAHLAMGAILLKKADYVGAAAEYRKSLDIQPDFFAWNNLGDAQLQMKQFVEAERSFRQAMAFNADNAIVRYNLGMALSELGRREEALEEVRKSLAFDPNYADAKTLLRTLTGNTR
jgi:protein O-mannosyl-transferase